MTATTNPRLGGKANTPYILAQCGVPIGIAPSGTMAANGAVTLGTALNATYSGGVWLYYAAGAVYAGSTAGFYWTVMSSTTVGTVYNNTYVPGTNSWDIPASPTAIVAAGPGAFTGSTSEITAFSVTLPGGSLGKNGRMFTQRNFAHSNSANNKTLQEKLGSGVFGASTRTTTTVSRESNWITNAGNEAVQLVLSGGVAFADMTATVAQSNIAVDTSVDKNYVLTLQLANATDYALLRGIVVEVFPL